MLAASVPKYNSEKKEDSKQEEQPNDLFGILGKAKTNKNEKSI